MSQGVLHFLVSGGLIALGVYLLDHPHALRSQTRLVRGVVIWIALVLGLRAIDYLFMP